MQIDLEGRKLADLFEKSQLNAYGTIYRITMQGDGLITYEWINSASYKNVIKRRASNRAVKQIISKLENMGFFELKNSYLSSDIGCKELTTSQTLVTMILKAGGRSREVRHYHGCKGFVDEKKLNKIERYIEKTFSLRRK